MISRNDESNKKVLSKKFQRQLSVARRCAEIPGENMPIIELRLKCTNLLGKDISSKPNAMAVILKEENEKWIELGKTESIKNCTDPGFTKCVELEYQFEETQGLDFRIYNTSSNSPEPSEDHILGALQCTLGQLVADSPFRKRLLFDNGAFAGSSTITIYAEEQTGNSEIYEFKFSAKGIDNKDFLGISDPYLEIHKRLPNEAWELLHRTEVKKNTLNPSWEPFTIRKNTLMNNNYSDEIKIFLWDQDGNGKNDFIGEVLIDFSDLTKATHGPVTWPCINFKKQIKKSSSYKDSGSLCLEYCKIIPEHTFLEYIFGGLHLSFSVGIDFTASNGVHENPNSLHHIDPNNPNEYQKAISSVGNIIQDYDIEQKFIAMGFGAKIPPKNEISYNFPLNLTKNDPYCIGVQGIVDAYKNCLTQVQLNGPTIVAPIIKEIISLAEKVHLEKKPSIYYVLLILTDGSITDMEDTQMAIVHASKLPMSIIIVGVGNGDFGSLTHLDSDNTLLTAPDGSVCARDIVQFIPFRQYQNAPATIFAKEVLAEIPRQVTQYYNLVNVPPSPPRFQLDDQHSPTKLGLS